MLRTGHRALRIEQRALPTLLSSRTARVRAAAVHLQGAPSSVPHAQRRAFSSTLPVRNDVGSSVVAQASSAADASPGIMATAIAKLEPLAVMLQDLPTLLHISGSPYAYALSIVALTYFLRTTLMLPTVLWARSRNERLATKVMPQWARLKATLPKSLALECRKEGLSYEEYEKKLQVDLKGALKKLIKEHRCSPLFTALAPTLGVSIPLFLVLSQVIRIAAGMPGDGLGTEVIAWWSPPEALVRQFEESAKLLAARGMEGESLQRLTMPMGPTLSQTDQTMVSPVALGLLTLTNVELSQWSRRTNNADEAEATLNAKGKEVSPVEKAKLLAEAQIEPVKSRALGNVMRGASILFVIVANQAPSAVVVYWLANFSYTLIQNSIFAIIDRRKAQAALLASAASPSAAGRIDEDEPRLKATSSWGGEVGKSATKEAPKIARARVGAAGRAAEQMVGKPKSLGERAQAELERRRGAK